MPYCLLVYDIPHDRTRTRLADLCLDYGLDRIQYSAFVGRLATTQQEELMLHARRLLGKRAGDIRLYPVCRTDWEAQTVIHVEEHGMRDTPDASDSEAKGAVPSQSGAPIYLDDLEGVEELPR